ncbi:hypothetical protein [Paenibacillus sp. FSL R7-0331]
MRYASLLIDPCSVPDHRSVH